MTIALIAYIVYLIVFAIINLAIIYHVNKYKYTGDMTQFTLLVYGVTLVTIVVVTFVMLGVF